MKNWSLIRLIVVIIFAVLFISLMFLKIYFKTDLEITKTLDLIFNRLLGIGAVALTLFLGYMMTREKQENH